MRKRVFFFVITLFTVLFIFSCSQYSPVLPSDMAKSGTWEDLFKALWTGLSDNYVFWDLDDANGEWDKVYEEYLPKFQELGAIDTSDEETTKKGTILLFDTVKNLSDGHFSIEAFGTSFSTSYYRMIKENYPGMSEEEVLERLYDFYSNFTLLPSDYYGEDAKSIMSSTFRIPLSFYVYKNTLSSDYNSLYFDWYDSEGKMRCIAVNPKIQLRASMSGESIILYSSSYKYGSGTTEDGEIIGFDSVEHYNNMETSVPGKIVKAYGPYYPISDLIWGSGGYNRLEALFSNWTLCLVLNTKSEYDSSDKTYKKSVSLELSALAGITKETEGSCDYVDYSSNTVYFLSSGFDFYKRRDIPEMKQFLMDFHNMKMNKSAEGMILDMRGNGGGYNADRELLFGDMFREPQLIGYQKNKTGSGRLDLSLEFPLYIYPEAAYYNNEFSDIANKPVVVATNSATASNGEMTVFMVRTLEKGGQVGGKTRGANGTLDGDIFETNSGQFSVGDYITSVYTPFGNIRDANHVSYEGKGLTPDNGYEIEFNKEVFFGEKGRVQKDERLEIAFKWIKDHK